MGRGREREKKREGERERKTKNERKMKVEIEGKGEKRGRREWGTQREGIWKLTRKGKDREMLPYLEKKVFKSSLSW